MIGGECKCSNVLSLTVLMVEGLTRFRVGISLDFGDALLKGRLFFLALKKIGGYFFGETIQAWFERGSCF